MAKKYSEILSHSRAGDLITGIKPSKAPLSLLPRTSWWKLFIDRKYHGEASPALLFDRDKSPRFYFVMMKAFGMNLGLKYFLHRRLDFAEYERLYHAVSDEVGGITNRGRSGTDSPVGSTRFPPIFVPGPAALGELAMEGVGYWNILGNSQQTRPTDKVTLMNTGLHGWQFYVKYKMQEAPFLANLFFNRYYQEISAAGGSPLAKLRAIVRLVRVLHVYHFFRDANGRLNTMVVLNKLLLENGFPPANVSDPAIFGGGYTIDQLVDDVHEGMKRLLREIEAHDRLRGLDLAL